MYTYMCMFCADPSKFRPFEFFGAGNFCFQNLWSEKLCFEKCVLEMLCLGWEQIWAEVGALCMYTSHVMVDYRLSIIDCRLSTVDKYMNIQINSDDGSGALMFFLPSLKQPMLHARL